MKILLAGFNLACLFAVFAGLTDDPRSRSEKILEGCKREFGSEGEERVNACALRITMRELKDQEERRIARAAQ